MKLITMFRYWTANHSRQKLADNRGCPNGKPTIGLDGRKPSQCGHKEKK